MPNARRIIATNLDPLVIAPDGSWVKFVLARYEEEVINYGRGDEEKGVIYVVGHDKKIVLNKINTEALAQLFGSWETDDWIGKEFYARGEYVDKPSGGKSFSWRFDNGAYALRVMQQQQTQAAMQSQGIGAQQAIDAQKSEAQTITSDDVSTLPADPPPGQKEVPGNWPSAAEAGLLDEGQEVDFG